MSTSGYSNKIISSLLLFNFGKNKRQRPSSSCVVMFTPSNMYKTFGDNKKRCLPKSTKSIKEIMHAVYTTYKIIHQRNFEKTWQSAILSHQFNQYRTKKKDLPFFIQTKMCAATATHMSKLLEWVSFQNCGCHQNSCTI